MSATRDIERLLDQWLAVGPDIAPPRAVDDALRIVDSMPQAVPGPGRLVPRVFRGPLMAPAFRLATVGLVVVALLVAMLALAGGRPSDLTFVSERYRYSIEHSATWTVTPATEDWELSRTWDASPEADVFRREGISFSVAATVVVGHPTVDHWAEVFVPERPELAGRLADRWCVDPRSASMPAIRVTAYRGWQASRVAGQDGVIRVACGYVDAVMFVGRRAYVVSMFTGRQALADLAAFDSMVRALEFVPDAPAATVAPRTAPPSMTPEPDAATFDSPLYGYRLAHPASWDIVPATERWAGSGELKTPVADRLGASGGLFIAAVDLADGVTVQAWLADHVPPPGEYDASGGFCRFGTFTGAMMVPAPRPAWYEDDVGGERALKRVSCGYVHAVVGIGRRAYVLELFTGRQPGADTAAFDAATDGIDFSPADVESAGTLDPNATVEFVSPRYGYAARVAWDWERSPAEGQLSDLQLLPRSIHTSASAGFDLLSSSSLRRIWAASVPADGQPLHAWVEEHLSPRQSLEPEAFSCRNPAGGIVMAVPFAAWRPVTIDGVEALERDSCYFIDVVAVAGDRVYLFSGRSIRPVHTSAADRAYFDEVLATVDLRPDDAVDAP